MSGSSIAVSYDQLQSAAHRLETHKQSIASELQQTQTLINELVSGGFVTQHASQRFNTAAEAFVTGSRHAIEGLSDLGRYLTQAAATLEQVDRDLAARIN